MTIVIYDALAVLACVVIVSFIGYIGYLLGNRHAE